MRGKYSCLDRNPFILVFFKMLEGWFYNWGCRVHYYTKTSGVIWIQGESRILIFLVPGNSHFSFLRVKFLENPVSSTHGFVWWAYSVILSSIIYASWGHKTFFNIIQSTLKVHYISLGRKFHSCLNKINNHFVFMAFKARTSSYCLTLFLCGSGNSSYSIILPVLFSHSYCEYKIVK